MGKLNLKDYLKIDSYKLNNGLRVVLITNNKVPVICIDVAYKVGSKDEVSGKTGFAHLFEHLMFEGTNNVHKGEFDKLCSTAGGSNNAYTSYDMTNYYMSLPSNQLELGLWLESDRMKNFKITEEALENQKSVVIEEINQTVEEVPYGKWRELLAEASFDKKCSYSWEVHGSKEDVANATIEDTEYFRKMYYQPANACLVVSGDIQLDTTKELIDKYFSSIPKYEKEISRNNFSKSLQNGNQKRSYKDNVPTSAVFLAFHCEGFKSDDIFAVEILSNILGNGRSSHFYKHLVENLQIASEVGAFVDKREFSSLLTFYALANNPEIETDRLYSEINYALEELLRNGISEKEITKSRNQLTTHLAYSIQSSSGLANAAVFQTIFWNNPQRIFSILDYYHKHSIDEIMTIADEILNKQNSIRIDTLPK